MPVREAESSAGYARVVVPVREVDVGYPRLVASWLLRVVPVNECWPQRESGGWPREGCLLEWWLASGGWQREGWLLEWWLASGG